MVKADLTCPKCGHVESVEMPTDSCLFFHRCAGCEELLKPLEGDCCVFCSYSDQLCPPKNEDDSCC